MAGIALMFDLSQPLSGQDAEWTRFVASVARFKGLEVPGRAVEGAGCVATKLDAACSLHRGFCQDEATGSWLLAAGTVISGENPAPDGDLASLLQDYQDRGSAALEGLDGHFALMIYDSRKQSVAVVSDPLGIISVFYGQKGERLFVSTSALAVATAVQARASELGTRQLILYGAQMGERTLWQGVKRMLPATVLALTRKGVQESTYWRLDFKPSIAGLSMQDSVDCVIDVLERSWRRGVAREGKVWLSLSGGLDSRMLAAVADYSRLPFKAYWHGPPDSRDVRIASQIAEEMGWERAYFSLPEDWGDQRAQWLVRTVGHTDGNLEVLKTSRIIREQALKAAQLGASLWGFGGETYRGYYWKQEFLRIGTTSRVDYDRLLDYRLVPSATPVLRDATQWRHTLREDLRAELINIGERQPDWPNNVKLDLIAAYSEHGWTGAHISAVLGLQRALAPFDFRDGVATVISVSHKWRRHGRLFRSMLERVAPALAEAETADGGPAAPMRVTNLHKFVPYWLDVGEKLVWGISRRYLKKSLWRKRDPGTDGTGYPDTRWRLDTLSHIQDQALLVPEKMYTGALYNRDVLAGYLADLGTTGFRHEALLGRILTVEMAMRAVGAGL